MISSDCEIVQYLVTQFVFNVFLSSLGCFSDKFRWQQWRATPTTMSSLTTTPPRQARKCVMKEIKSDIYCSSWETPKLLECCGASSPFVTPSWLLWYFCRWAEARGRVWSRQTINKSDVAQRDRETQGTVITVKQQLRLGSLIIRGAKE